MQLREQIARIFGLFMKWAVWLVINTSTANQVQEARAEVATLEEERSRVIGQIASQLNQINRQMIRIRAELVGLDETIGYRTVRAPIAGKVFDVKISRLLSTAIRQF